MARSIQLGQVYYNRLGQAFIPVYEQKGRPKRHTLWSDWNATGPKKYTDANGYSLHKNKIFTREDIYRFLKNQLREIKRNAKNYAFQNRKYKS